jgi:hypothetical protein
MRTHAHTVITNGHDAVYFRAFVSSGWNRAIYTHFVCNRRLAEGYMDRDDLETRLKALFQVRNRVCWLVAKTLTLLKPPKLLGFIGTSS